MRAAGPPHSQSRALSPTLGPEARPCVQPRPEGHDILVSSTFARLRTKLPQTATCGFLCGQTSPGPPGEPHECDGRERGASVWRREHPPRRLPRGCSVCVLQPGGDFPLLGVLGSSGRCQGSGFRHSVKRAVVSHGSFSLRFPDDTRRERLFMCTCKIYR